MEAKLANEEDGRERLYAVRPRDRVTVGSFSIEFLRVTHSMPDCVALAITTPAGVVLHTGDFKIDQTPLDGEHVDFHRLAQLGADGVLVLLGDSTNIERKGVSGSERDVIDALTYQPPRSGEVEKEGRKVYVPSGACDGHPERRIHPFIHRAPGEDRPRARRSI